MPSHSPLLQGLQFDTAFTQALPVDARNTPSPRAVEGAVFSYCAPTPVQKPVLLGWSDDAAALLGLSGVGDPQLVAEIFSGNRLLPGSRPYATCYGGHQFGQWAGQLGDGRALMLGTAIGKDDQRWEIQLKGAGMTPYSRHADGRAVLRSSIREYLCSEAMHHLGVPTTRALCLVGTGDDVVRDMFYDGRAAAEPGAIVTRLAPSFLRFGHYEIFAARQELDILRRLVDFTITQYFKALGTPSRDVYIAWFDTVCQRTADLMAHWLRVGFVHGVMNTDNLSILGLSIDYGPYGWLDHFDTAFTPNTTDRGGRYAYGNQAQIAAWNLNCLGNALMPLVEDAKALEACLARYATRFEAGYLKILHDKLGLPAGCDSDAAYTVIAGLFECFAQTPTDMTIFFRRLATCIDLAPDAALRCLSEAFYADSGAAASAQLVVWLKGWQALVVADPHRTAQQARMNAVNPWLIPRNWLAQQAIQAAEQGDMSLLDRLMRAVRQPYEASPEFADLAVRRPEWALNSPGCSALSCSS